MSETTIENSESEWFLKFRMLYSKWLLMPSAIDDCWCMLYAADEWKGDWLTDSKESFVAVASCECVWFRHDSTEMLKSMNTEKDVHCTLHTLHTTYSIVISSSSGSGIVSALATMLCLGAEIRKGMASPAFKEWMKTSEKAWKSLKFEVWTTMPMR